MFKNKALVIVTILVLALSVVAMSCAPAAKPATTTPPATTAAPATTTSPATTTTPPSTPPSPPGGPATTTPAATTPATGQPAAVEKKTSFASQKYTNDANGFSVSYPAAWKEAAKPYGTAVFYANDGAAPLPDIFLVDVRPGTSVKEAAIAALTDFVSSKGVSASPTAESEKTVTLADGKTSATELVLSASVMFMTKKGYALGVVKGGNVITVQAGIDPGKLDFYKEIIETLVIK